jgi:hypothetical protein
MRHLLSVAVAVVVASTAGALAVANGDAARAGRPVRAFDAGRSPANETVVLQWSVGPNCTQESTRDGVLSGSCCYDCFGFYGFKMTASKNGSVVTRDTFGMDNFNCTGKPTTRTDYDVDKCYEGFDPQGVGVVISVQPSRQ